MGFDTGTLGSMAQNNIDMQGMQVRGGAQSGGGSGLSAGLLTSAFGAGMSATGAYTQAKNQQAALQAEAQVAQNNATLAGWQAEDSIARGEVAAGQAMMKGGQIKGAQRAAMAANGVDLSYGSAQLIQNDTDYLTSVDAATLRDNAAREAWGYRQQARGYTDKAAAARSGAGSISPWLSAGTSLLGSATSVASRWYQTNARGG
jgi:hypothetical protein